MKQRFQRCIVSLLLILCGVSAVAQKKPEHDLVLRFQPSFDSHRVLSITNLSSNPSIKLQVLHDKTTANTKAIEETKNLTKKETNELITFLSTYQFKIKGSVDTSGSIKVVRNGDTITMHQVSFGIDGITVKGTYHHENIIKDFAFWSPKQGSENYKLILIILSLAENSFSNKNSKNYLVSLKKYFNQAP